MKARGWHLIGATLFGSSMRIAPASAFAPGDHHIRGDRPCLLCSDPPMVGTASTRSRAYRLRHERWFEGVVGSSPRCRISTDRLPDIGVPVSGARRFSLRPPMRWSATPGNGGAEILISGPTLRSPPTRCGSRSPGPAQPRIGGEVMAAGQSITRRAARVQIGVPTVSLLLSPSGWHRSAVCPRQRFDLCALASAGSRGACCGATILCR
jgi:hypothetical protein